MPVDETVQGLDHFALGLLALGVGKREAHDQRGQAAVAGHKPAGRLRQGERDRPDPLEVAVVE